MKRLLILCVFLTSCTSVTAIHEGMKINYTRFGSRNIKSIEFESTNNGVKATIKGLVDNENVKDNLENIVKLVDAIK